MSGPRSIQTGTCKRLVCHVEADLSALPKHPQTSSFNYSNYYSVSFEVVLTLGLTEDRVIIVWKQNVRQVFLQI